MARAYALSCLKFSLLLCLRGDEGFNEPEVKIW
jgi:hypothetical protein